MKKIIFAPVLFVLCSVYCFAQLRSLNDIFPNLNHNTRTAVFSESGFMNNSRAANRSDLLGTPRAGSRLAPELTASILNQNPRYLVETIMVIRAQADVISLLDVYNALSNIRSLSGILYDSFRRDQAVPLFEDATRITGERQNSAIPDPPRSTAIPSSETIFIRLKDANFGNSFYRAEMRRLHPGIVFTMTNFRSLSYLFVPVIREGNLVAQLYIEPIDEGVLIYGIAGATVSDFLASRIHVDSAISKRLGVIMTWASNTIRRR